MSVIQKIRDKYARVAVVAIGLALLGFILMDAFAGRGSFFGDRDTIIGKINGKKLDYDVFNRRVTDIARRQGQQAQTDQIVAGLWDQEVADAVMGEQYEALGITITDKEFDQLLFGPNPPEDFRRAFTDQQNPQQAWDPAAVRIQYNNIKKTGPPDQKAGLDELVEYVKKQALLNKYNALLANSIYIPKWFLDKRNADNSQMARGAFVAVPYTSVNDSTVKVTDAEVLDYAKAHKKDFEVEDETRTISYVQFSANPSAADSAAVQNTLQSVRDSFAATTDVKEFLLKNKSQVQYNDTWLAQKDLTLQNADTIFKTPVGQVAGPFIESGLVLLTKALDRKTQPDTAKVRHILIGTATQDPQSGQFIPTKDTLVAKKTADSIMAAIAAGANFDTLLVQLSDDPSKVNNKGVFDSITRGSNLVPEFKEFALDKPAGSKGIVKTAFGYHYMEVINQRGSSPVFKMAFFALPLEASTETINTASSDASMLAGTATDEKSFNDYFEKNLKSKGLTKLSPPNPLRPMDFTIPGITGKAREFVKDIFKAKKGDVVGPSQPINNNYLVAVVTDVQEPGIPAAAVLRPQILPVLVNKKKAAQIKTQMGSNITDLNAVATKFNVQVQPVDSVRFAGGGVLGYEGKVLGALFNQANKGKVTPEPIAGQTGVYVLRVDATFAGVVENAGIEEQRKMMEMQSRQQYRSPEAVLQILRKQIEIKDYRSKFY